MLLLGKFKVVGHSMEPQIKTGQLVLVSNISYLFKSPKINDIVAFRDNGGKVLIKRIIKIESGEYFVEGDNKNDSLDSRKFGGISKDKIIGEVILKL
jgi:nickel-type superoxide dismutase maturation protease